MSAAETYDVAVVGGTGALGNGLARRLAAAGRRVVIGSRDAGRAAAAAAELEAALGVTVAGTANADAAPLAPVVAVCVPFAAHAATLKDIAGALAPGQLVLDTTVPLAPAVGGRPTRVVGVWQGSAAEQARELLPDGVALVAGLHSVAAASLADPGHVFDEDTLLCGDDADAKRRVAALLTGAVAGLRPVDAGKLELARIVEPITALMISVNRRHKAHAGLRITGLPDVLWPDGEEQA